MTERKETSEPSDGKVSSAPATDAEGESGRGAAQSEPAEVALDALWNRVMQAWDDDKPHHALLEYALRAQKLPDVAGRYRAVKEKDAEKAARAQKKLDGIVIAATQMLMSMKSPPDKYKVPPAVSALIFAASVLMLAWLTYAVFHRR